MQTYILNANFVGRYETSIDGNKRVYSQEGVTPASAETNSANTWWGFYAYQKNMAKTNKYTSLNSNMIWECNYDAMLRWALEGQDAQKVTGTENAVHDQSVLYETGKNTIEGKEDRINNVYDLEGNGIEWTMAMIGSYSRSSRGGACNFIGSPSRNGANIPTYTNANIVSRLTLFIK